MSETDLVSTEAPAAPKKRGGLTGMVLAELRALAGELNIPDIAGMRKGDLIAAIKERQAGAPAVKAPKAAKPAKAAAAEPSGQLSLADPTPATSENAAAPAAAPAAAAEAPAERPTRRRRVASRPAGAPDPTPAAEPSTNGSAPAAEAPAVEAPAAAPVEAPAETPAEQGEQPADGQSRRQRRRRAESVADAGEAPSVAPEKEKAPEQGDRQQGGRGENRDGRNRNNQGNQQGGNQPQAGGQNDNRGPRDNRPGDDDDEDGDGRGRRGRRFRDRRRGRDRERPGGAGGQNTVDTEVRDGDVLLPVAGIVDILDNYAFVRTTGYLSGPTDVYVSLSMVRKYGLRRGDAITGTVREPREGEQSRQKFNPLVRVDSINGQDPEQARNRPEFTKLTPLYPNERLRLETEPHKLTTRVIDLVMPVGKGQRALIVSPPKAGKTTIMQNIANAITTNNPECHLMVVLVDERPEEVTDMQRSVKGEVIASTFDRPPTDHTTVAELSIERAKRLVEMGHDVVVLLDNITRLGRAYNLAAPASGRILSGGVDSTALYPPKRFLGAARNIEDGGSLTIFATALVETGSTMDTVIFEEFKGTGNAELKLDRKIADKRIFPAIDVGDSSTRKDELLMSPDEYAVMVKLRRVLSALDDQQAIDLLLTQLKKTRTNIEFLMQVAKNAPGSELD
ncbi:transcription termination factor Rho [Pseudonocardia sp. CA-107938]|uniref:transcription termination factor Rho n=1 Tax=Pseudonocardia sp. CA-107938 TaxID=3240021 RepID=UPI003D932C59